MSREPLDPFYTMLTLFVCVPSMVRRPHGVVREKSEGSLRKVRPDFSKWQADAGLFIRHGKDPVYVLVYVDDLLFASKHLSDVDHVKQCIMSAFQARDLGNASYFLGMDIVCDRTNGTLVLGQRKYM
jgi:hypothetical protein